MRVEFVASSIRSTTAEEYQHHHHSKCTNISYRNYFAGLIIRYRKYFTVLKNIRIFESSNNQGS